jgi:cobalt-zinc-cadmium efflux system protein
MPHTDKHRHTLDEKQLRWALLLTAIFMLVEVVGGVLSGSLALLADAGHMLTDSAALGLAWLAARISDKPADHLRSYGYHRLQILAAFINGVAFMAVVAWIGFEAVSRLLEPRPVDGMLMIVVAATGLLVNVAVFVILHSPRSMSLNVRAASIHVLGDLLGSVAAIVAAGVILVTGWMQADPILSILVALLILRSAWIIVRQSAHILLEGTPPDMDVDLLRTTLIDEVEGVRDVHHVHLWALTPERPLITMHIDAVPSSNHVGILKEVKCILSNRFGIAHSTVQVEDEHCVD